MGLHILVPNQEIKTIRQESCQCGYCGRTNKAELDNCKGCGADVVVTPLFMIEVREPEQSWYNRGTNSTGPK